MHFLEKLIPPSVIVGISVYLLIYIKFVLLQYRPKVWVHPIKVTLYNFWLTQVTVYSVLLNKCLYIYIDVLLCETILSNAISFSSLDTFQIFNVKIFPIYP